MFVDRLGVTSFKASNGIVRGTRPGLEVLQALVKTAPEFGAPPTWRRM